MIDKKGYDAEAREVVNSICGRIIKDYQFQIDSSNPLMGDDVSKVLYKGDLEIVLFWDYMEAQITFNFKNRNVNHIGVDFRRIRSKYLSYEGIKNLFKYKNEKPGKYSDLFIPKAKERQLHEFLNDWYDSFPLLFETGDYSLISHLESGGHGDPEEMKKERELIKEFQNSIKNNS